ncbi:hypothetical protein E2320_005621 [Naja naja]|nr:hypothetical protein E2320_005621 [Naja naja]
MADKLVFSSYVRWPSWIFFNLHRAILLGMVLRLSPACCSALKIGLVGPWSSDSFFSNSLPEVATQLAMERIKKDPSLAAVHPMDYVLLEEDLQTWKAMARFVESSKNRSAFVGPLNPSYCEAASLLAQGWNQAMLSWACLNDDLDKPRNQPWFIKTLPSVATVLLTVLRYFNWAHVGIISSKGDFWVDTAHKLASVLRSHGLPVAVVISTGAEAEKVEEAWTKVEAAGNIKGEDQAAFLSKAQELGLADGRYVFVPYDTLFYSLPYRNHSYFLLENDGAFRKAYDAVARPQTSELFGTNLIHHVRNLDFAGFSHRIQIDSKGQPLARYVILDTDGKESHLYPTYLLTASSGMMQPLGRAIHFPGGTSPPVDSACWFEPDALCERDDAESRSCSEAHSLRSVTHSLSMRELRHENVNPFLGLLSDTGLSAVVMNFCSRGSLQDLLQNMDIKLDWMNFANCEPLRTKSGEFLPRYNLAMIHSCIKD